VKSSTESSFHASFLIVLLCSVRTAVTAYMFKLFDIATKQTKPSCTFWNLFYITSKIQTKSGVFSTQTIAATRDCFQR